MLRAQQPTATAPQRLQSACILAAAVTLLLLVVTHTHSGGGGQQQPADSSSSPGQTAGATAAAALDEPLGNRGSVDGGGEEEFHFRSMEDAAGQEHCPPKPIDKVTKQPKTQWPELVGKSPDEARATLEAEAPGFTIQVIKPDHMATMEWRCTRIRIWLGKDGRVSQPPMIG